MTSPVDGRSLPQSCRVPLQRGAECADLTPMLSLPVLVVVLLIVPAIAIVTYLHMLAGVVRQDRMIHDLRIECITMRNHYIRRLHIMGGASADALKPTGTAGVDILD